MTPQQSKGNKTGNEGKSAIANGLNLPISIKHAVHISKMIRGKNVATAKIILQEVIDEKKPVPFRTNANGMGHKKGPLGAGRYPQKACKNILSLLESAEKNASFKGMNTSTLHITSLVPSKGPTVMRSGRGAGQAKNTHVYIVLGEHA